MVIQELDPSFDVERCLYLNSILTKTIYDFDLKTGPIPGVSTDPCNKFRIWRYTLSQLTTLQIFHDDPLLEHVSQASVPTCQFLEAPTFDITDRSPSRLISPCLGMIHLVSTEPKRFITPIRHCSVDTELICLMICAK